MCIGIILRHHLCLILFREISVAEKFFRLSAEYFITWFILMISLVYFLRYTNFTVLINAIKYEKLIFNIMSPTVACSFVTLQFSLKFLNEIKLQDLRLLSDSSKQISPS